MPEIRSPGRPAACRRPSGSHLLLGVVLAGLFSLPILFGGAVAAGDGGDQETAAASLFRPSADAWPVFRGNLLGTGVAGTTLPDEPKLLWTFDTESEIEGTAAIVGGVVYFGDYEGRVYALTLAEGRELWRFDAGTPIKAPVSVFDDVVYVGDEYGYVYALDAGSGEQKWKFETLGEIFAGVSLHEDRLLVGSYDNSLYCLDRASGEKVWQVETDGYVHGTPAVADGLTTVSGCDGFMWLIDIETGETIHKIDLRGQAASSPAVVGDMAYVATYENEVLGIDLAKRQVAWAYEHEIRKFPFYASAAADDEIVVIGGRDKIVHALDPRDGRAEVGVEQRRAARLLAGDRGRSGLPGLQARPAARARQGDGRAGLGVRYRFGDHGLAGGGLRATGHRQPGRHPVLLRVKGARDERSGATERRAERGRARAGQA